MVLLLSIFARFSSFLWIPHSSASPALDCPPFSQLPARKNAKLPNPFLSLNGNAVKDVKNWQCRREEISTIIQQMELGIKPPRPSKVTGRLSSNRLDITCQEGEKSITFSPTISYPPTGSAPYPAIIALKGLTIPKPAGVAIITFNTDDIGQHSGGQSRNKGKFFELYGSNGAGAMITWAWAVSRIVDVLETLTATNINPKKIGVTGCSRWGKGALVAGAFDERIALTIPQESGSGGTACWRMCDVENQGAKVQTAAEIVGENVWYSTNFTKTASTDVKVLPYDHHMLTGLVAPRGLLSIDNSGVEWLAPKSTFGCNNAAHLIWEALGVADNMGESLSEAHEHCKFPSQQQPEVQAFFDKFLLDKASSTKVMKAPNNIAFSKGQWIDWTVPKLS